MARRLGLGEKTGLPLKAEAEGFVPTDYWYYKKFGYYMSKGDLANISIGQGMVETSPLQVARMMAAVGNRQYVVKARLVKQVQEYNHKVIQAYPVEQRSALNIEPHYLDILRQGMKEVVNSGRGTGRSAANSLIVVAGKTGTGQWIPAEERNIGWFAGFAPADAPVYSFAVVSEGEPGETVGGGKNAAPVIGGFFEKYLENEEHLTEIQKASEEVRIALAETEVRTLNAQPVGGSIFRETAVADQYQNQGGPPMEARREGEGGLQRFFRRLGGR
jgi:penicillin-binding protein 2